MFVFVGELNVVTEDDKKVNLTEKYPRNFKIILQNIWNRGRLEAYEAHGSKSDIRSPDIGRASRVAYGSWPWIHCLPEWIQ